MRGSLARGEVVRDHLHRPQGDDEVQASGFVSTIRQWCQVVRNMPPMPRDEPLDALLGRSIWYTLNLADFYDPKATAVTTTVPGGGVC
jgi:hypothetical protein